MLLLLLVVLTMLLLLLLVMFELRRMHIESESIWAVRTAVRVVVLLPCAQRQLLLFSIHKGGLRSNGSDR